MPTLAAPDGTQLVYDAYEPPQPRAALLLLHGWSDHAGRWREVGERLRVAGRVLQDLWPTLGMPLRLDPEQLSRDPAVNKAYCEDPAVHDVMSPGAWREIRWAQGAVVADAQRIESPLLFLLAGEDRVVDAHLGRAFADGLTGAAEVRWYPEVYHEILHDPQRERAVGDILGLVDAQLDRS